MFRHFSRTRRSSVWRRFLSRSIMSRHEPRVVQLQSGSTGLPLYFVGAGPAEHLLAQLHQRGSRHLSVDAPMPVEWLGAITAADQATLPTIEQLGAILRRCFACACGIVTLHHRGILLRRQDSIRSRASAAACRGQCRVGPSCRCAGVHLEWTHPRTGTGRVFAGFGEAPPMARIVTFLTWPG